MLRIQHLSVTVNETTTIINSFSLDLQSGCVHALMGPNGSGKSSLAYALVGHPHYQVTHGNIFLGQIDITHLTPDKRAQAGLFLAFQYPPEIPGLSIFNFLKEMHYALTKLLLSVDEFKLLLFNTMDLLGIEHNFAQRNLNEGFSGGQKKKFEMLQALLVNPKIIIFDEIDSGLDVDALKVVAQGIELLRTKNPAISILLITHYQRILDYIIPDVVHIMVNGKLAESGNFALAQHIEQQGYDKYVKKEI